MNFRMFRNIKKSKFYRGQIYWGRSYKSVPAFYYPLKIFSEDVENLCKEILELFGLKNLYYHQGESIKKLLEGNDVFLTLNEGAGKSTLVEIVSIVWFVKEKKNVLNIKPGYKKLGERKNSIIDKLSRSRWNSEVWRALTEAFGMVELTPQQLREVLLNERGILFRSILLSKIGLVIIEDITSYSPEELLHLKFLIKILKLFTKDQIRFLLTGTPIYSSHEFIDEVVGSNAVVISDDGSPKSEFYFVNWIPPLEARRGKDEKSLKIKRRNYIDEATSLCSNLLQGGLIKKVLIWHAFSHISKDEIGKIKLSLQNSENLGESSQFYRGYKMLEINSPAEIPKGEMRSFDVCIILGMPKDFLRLPGLLGNVLAKGGVAILIAPEDPLTHLLMRERFSWESIQGIPEIVLPDSYQLTKDYFLRSLVASEDLKINLKKFGERKHLEEIVSSLLGNEIVIRKDNTATLINYIRVYDEMLDIPWGALSSDYVIFEKDAEHFFYSDRKLIPYLYFPYGLLYHGFQKFILRQLKDNTISLYLAPEGSSVLRIPIVENIISNEKELDKKITGLGEIKKVRVIIEEKLWGYRYYEDYSFPPQEEQKKAFVKFEEPLFEGKRETIGIYSCIQEAHAFGHLLKIFLPIFLKDAFRGVSLFHKSNNLYIFAVSEGYYKFIDYLYDNWEIIIKKIFSASYELLISCPCKEGCPLCLQIFDCKEVNIPSKRSIMEEIAKKIGKSDEVETLLAFRERGLEGDLANKIYRKWRDRILEIFEKKLSLFIKKKADLVGVKPGSLGQHIGLYCNGLVKIIYGLPEIDAVETIAHEYAHNWELDPGGVNMDTSLLEESVPFNGRLVSEGFAQWVAFKTLDFFRLIDNMEKIELREYDEYGEGFDLIYFIETRIGGFDGVLEFIQKGRVIDRDTEKEYNLRQLLKESGVEERIKRRSFDLKERGNKEAQI